MQFAHKNTRYGEKVVLSMKSKCYKPIRLELIMTDMKHVTSTSLEFPLKRWKRAAGENIRSVWCDDFFKVHLSHKEGIGIDGQDLAKAWQQIWLKEQNQQ